MGMFVVVVVVAEEEEEVEEKEEKGVDGGVCNELNWKDVIDFGIANVFCGDVLKLGIVLVLL
jgi:hypothetical protein